jgi:hypothetical protein
MGTAALALALLAGYWAGNRLSLDAQVYGNDNNISMMDTCDPSDAGWDATGGCTLRRHQGDVDTGEFDDLLLSPLAQSTIGHPAWRNEPSHINTTQGRGVRVTNTGGRVHTFTKVAEFGGGRVPPLNTGLTQAKECISPGVVNVAPGTTQVLDLSEGLHRFQCCIHPWMRATVRVE